VVRQASTLFTVDATKTTSYLLLISRVEIALSISSGLNWTPLEAVNSWHVQKHVFPPSNHPVYATKLFIMAATTYFLF